MQRTKKYKPNKLTNITIKTYRKNKKIIKKTYTVKVYYKYKYLKNPFLSATTRCEVNDPRIKAKAKAITKGCKTNYQKANAIYKWVRKKVKYKSSTPLSATDVLKYKETNCVGYSNLIIALCRSVGVPATYGSALRYDPNSVSYSNNHPGHAWALIYVNGRWIYADGAIITPQVLSIGSTTSWASKTKFDMDRFTTEDYKLKSWDPFCNKKFGHAHNDGKFLDRVFLDGTKKLVKNLMK